MIATLLTAAGAAQQKPAADLGNSAFEGYIELLRQQASIPALSGVLIQDHVIAWERGLGFANLESRIAARSDTPYAIGDLTEAFTSVLLLQCAEQRRLDLNEPVRAWGINLPERTPRFARCSATRRREPSSTTPSGSPSSRLSSKSARGSRSGRPSPCR